MTQDARVYSMMVEHYRADHSRAKLDHDLIVPITTRYQDG